MKKYITIIVLLLTVTVLNAQYVNKDYLPGKWGVYSMRLGDIYLCKDSIEQSRESFFKAMKKDGKGKLTKEEKLEIDEQLQRLVSGLDESYLQFNKDGTGKAYFALDEEEDEDLERTYKWVSDTELQLMRNGEHYTTLKVISITKTRLVVTKTFGEGADEPNVVVFRKR